MIRHCSFGQEDCIAYHSICHIFISSGCGINYTTALSLIQNWILILTMLLQVINTIAFLFLAHNIESYYLEIHEHELYLPCSINLCIHCSQWTSRVLKHCRSSPPKITYQTISCIVIVSMFNFLFNIVVVMHIFFTAFQYSDNVWTGTRVIKSWQPWTVWSISYKSRDKQTKMIHKFRLLPKEERRKNKNKQEMCASQNTPVYIKQSCCQKLYL